MFNHYRKVARPVFAAAALGFLILVMAACGSVTAASTLSDSLANASQPSNHQSGESYRFKTLDDQADPTFNQLLGINNNGKIAGYFGSGASGHPNKGYTLSKPYHQNDYTNAAWVIRPLVIGRWEECSSPVSRDLISQRYGGAASLPAQALSQLPLRLSPRLQAALLPHWLL